MTSLAIVEPMCYTEGAVIDKSILVYIDIVPHPIIECKWYRLFDAKSYNERGQSYAVD